MVGIGVTKEHLVAEVAVVVTAEVTLAEDAVVVAGGVREMMGAMESLEAGAMKDRHLLERKIRRVRGDEKRWLVGSRCVRSLLLV
jgi:hypothetical protein